MDALSLDDGFDRLQLSLEQVGSGPLALPGLDEPERPSAYVRMILTGCAERGWDFDKAWSAAVNRLQPSQLGGVVEIGLADTLREERALLEEDRGLWRAAYERRDPTARERAESTVAAWHRLDAGDRGTRPGLAKSAA